MNRVRKRLPNHPTGPQLRAARAMARMSIDKVAERAGLAEGTIKRAEKAEGPAPITNANAKLIMAALEAEGIVFIPAGEFGPGVCQQLNSATPEARMAISDTSRVSEGPE